MKTPAKKIAAMLRATRVAAATDDGPPLRDKAAPRIRARTRARLAKMPSPKTKTHANPPDLPSHE